MSFSHDGTNNLKLFPAARWMANEKKSDYSVPFFHGDSAREVKRIPGNPSSAIGKTYSSVNEEVAVTSRNMRSLSEHLLLQRAGGADSGMALCALVYRLRFPGVQWGLRYRQLIVDFVSFLGLTWIEGTVYTLFVFFFLYYCSGSD